MNRKPGQIEVTVETGYCSFCDRVRNLRREERHLGTLVRTVIVCESCHRTLSSTMGVATSEAPEVEEGAAVEAEATPEPKPEADPRPAKPAAAKPATATRSKTAAASTRPKTPKSRTAKTK